MWFKWPHYKLYINFFFLKNKKLKTPWLSMLRHLKSLLKMASEIIDAWLSSFSAYANGDRNIEISTIQN